MRRTSLHIYSTVHLPEAEREAIDALILTAPRDVGGRLVVEHLDLVIEPYQFGFFVHTGVCEDEAERPESISPEFWAILRAAAMAGAAWMLFDRDEPPTQGLPMFGARPIPDPCHNPRQREYHHD
ncbi:hypothetical protein KFK14_09405 [Sphingobium phenoxybenzoativorans]|jgi:hypothetical protein|uniref:DUF5983 domain-containing protein n=1 Tax=Sphingobium phenoxybenzoativorans TaxID=1592790 RepID=A0A975Q318_9SPHN|nr:MULTISPECIES: hypothetical protein [Sphingobium]QUT07585.1 hypothetical protein KFK14_09405 [Sphingobium phenoxybenzoativorans]